MLGQTKQYQKGKMRQVLTKYVSTLRSSVIGSLVSCYRSRIHKYNYNLDMFLYVLIKLRFYTQHGLAIYHPLLLYISAQLSSVLTMITSNVLFTLKHFVSTSNGKYMVETWFLTLHLYSSLEKILRYPNG